ncbi:MAG: hypothetical protein M1830_003510 [Pleopsidium flavum]|nr:MAG: hypothetical protein M1830_003510 [Pleopsidium flavum]
MAPSPAAGKAAGNAPKTPTKPGKNPASSATSKLGQSTSAADSPKNGAKSATNTPKSAAKGTPSKAKENAPSADSPKLPPRPKDGDDAASKAKDTASDAKEKAPDAPEPAKDAKDDAEGEAEETGDKIGMKDNDPTEGDDEETDTPQGKVSQAGNETGAEESSAVSTANDDLEEAAPEPVDDDDDEDAVGGAKDKAEDAANGAEDKAEDAADDAEAPDTEEAEGKANQAKEKAGGLANGAKGAAGKAAGKAAGAKDKAGEGAEKAAEGDANGVAEDTADGVEDTAEDAADEAGDEVPDEAEDAADGAKETAEGAKDKAEDAVEGAKDTAEDAADQAPVDLSVLKGLEVGEGGQILGEDGEPIGQLDEGDPEDMAGKTIGDNGEILDEDGDVIGRASVLPDKAKELADQAKDGLPDVGVLDGREVGEGGEILGDDGTPLGKIVDGDHEDLVGQKMNEKGEILDEDGEVIGRAEVVPGEAADKLKDAADEAGGLVPDLSILEGKKLNKKGNILDEEGEQIGKLTEDSDPKKCAGKVPNENGEIVDDKGNVVGKVEVVPGEAADEAMKALHPDDVPQEAEEAADAPDLSSLEGLKVNKKGEVLNEDGEPVAKLSEGELADVAGKKINDKGEIIDKEGNVIGKVEMIPQEPEEPEEPAEDAGPELPPLSILEGLKCNKQGKIVTADGKPVGELIEGDPKKLAKSGTECDAEGQFWDGKGHIVGKAKTLPEEDDEEDAPFSGLEGLIVVKDGWVEDENGNKVGTIVEGDPKKLVGRAVDEDGDVIDKRGNTVGHADRYEEPEEAEPEKADLSVLEGKAVNKQGNVIGDEGVPIGRLVEGNAKDLAGKKCDDQGQIWNDSGKVIGRCELIPESEREAKPEGPFAGLQGLIVVKNAMVEDEEGNTVGQVVEGDAKKLVGRAVDEDGDIIDKYGNVKGHAEPYEEPEEQVQDLSVLNGKAVNKQGNVIGDEGVPIARLVEGNAKELAGKKCDGEGQLWNDAGKVIGRCELIPENEREAKPEGPFAGLQGLVVGKDGMVKDEEGNTVGQVVEGDAKKLVGRAVDEDGDIIDKYGNVKGHAEPYEEPEEEAEDLSVLEGKVVNKAGNVVDEHGTAFGRISSGDPKKLAGRKVDGQGQIWSDNGKVIGKAELIPGGEQEKAEGPFSGWENLVVGKDGVVQDANEQIVGRLIEGDPKKLMGRKVDEDGDVLDKGGNSLGKAERWEPEEKERHINPMSGHKVNHDGEVRDADGNLLGKVTEGNVKNLIGMEVDDNGYVVDNDGNKVGACTLMENLEEEEEEGPSEEELAAMKKAEEDKELANKMGSILQQTLEKIEPVCKQITERIEKADRTPREELDEEQLVQDVKPLLEEGGRILSECNGSIRGLDPDGRIASNAKARAANREATPEEYRLADLLKEVTTTVVKTIDNAKKRIADMPHAKKGLSPLWGLLTEPLFQIIAAVGLLLSGVLGLVGKLLNGLGLGGLVNGLLGGLGIDKLLGGIGLGSITESLGLGGGKKKK